MGFPADVTELTNLDSVADTVKAELLNIRDPQTSKDPKGEFASDVHTAFLRGEHACCNLNNGTVPRRLD
jgi:hypothetical protein